MTLIKVSELFKELDGSDKNLIKIYLDSNYFKSKNILLRLELEPIK